MFIRDRNCRYRKPTGTFLVTRKQGEIVSRNQCLRQALCYLGQAVSVARQVGNRCTSEAGTFPQFVTIVIAIPYASIKIRGRTGTTTDMCDAKSTPLRDKFARIATKNRPKSQHFLCNRSL